MSTSNMDSLTPLKAKLLGIRSRVSFRAGHDEERPTTETARTLSTHNVNLDEGQHKKHIKVAIVGGGPGGLGAALELTKLPFVTWKLYEKKPNISEIGAGISLQPQTWRLLERNGAASSLSTTSFFRPIEGLIEQRR